MVYTFNKKTLCDGYKLVFYVHIPPLLKKKLQSYERAISAFYQLLIKA